MGSWAREPFCAASTTFPEFPRAAQTAAHREGRGGRDRDGAGRKRPCSLGAGAWFVPRDTRTTLSELFTELKPKQWKVSASSKPEKTTRGPIKGTREVHQGPPGARLRAWRPCALPHLSGSPAPEHCYKTSHPTSQVGTHSFRGQEPTVSPRARQSNRAVLFYFSPNPCLRDSIRHWCRG